MYMWRHHFRDNAGMQVCLLGGLQAVTDGELPLLTSDFYAKHMLPAKPEGGPRIP